MPEPLETFESIGLYFCLILTGYFLYYTKQRKTSIKAPPKNGPITTHDRRLNDLLRGLVPFDQVCEEYPEWKTMSELDVLADRVKMGKKPFATYVVAAGGESKAIEIERHLQHMGLTVCRCIRLNSKIQLWELRFCLYPNLKLSQFIDVRLVQSECENVSIEIDGKTHLSKTLAYYLKNGCESPSQSPIEIGAANGYSLDGCITQMNAFQRFRKIMND